MKRTHRIRVCLIIFLIYYFDIMNSLKADQDSFLFIMNR